MYVPLYTESVLSEDSVMDKNQIARWHDPASDPYVILLLLCPLHKVCQFVTSFLLQTHDDLTEACHPLLFVE